MVSNKAGDPSELSNPMQPSRSRLVLSKSVTVVESRAPAYGYAVRTHRSTRLIKKLNTRLQSYPPTKLNTPRLICQPSLLKYLFGPLRNGAPNNHIP